MQSKTSSAKPRSLGDYYADRLSVIGRNLIAQSATTNTLALPLSPRETHALDSLRSLRGRRTERLASLLDVNTAARSELMMLEADFAATLVAAEWWMAEREHDDERTAARLLSDPDLIDLPGLDAID